jgi:hypothetical protein
MIGRRSSIVIRHVEGARIVPLSQAAVERSSPLRRLITKCIATSRSAKSFALLPIIPKRRGRDGGILIEVSRQDEGPREL